LWLFACGALAVSSAVWWPAQSADIRMLLERQAVIPTESAVPLERPDRPSHPRSMYYPPGEPAPKVPGDPGYVHP
jgi:hypothetical protein